MTSTKTHNTPCRVLCRALLAGMIMFAGMPLLLQAASALEEGYKQLPDGSLYKGELKYGVIRDGQGHNKWSDGREYTGQWFNDQPHGKGMLVFPDGTVYRGEFVYGSYHGFGQLKTGDTTFTGQFQNGEQSGIGLLEAVNDEYFLGEFYRTQKHGRILFFASATAKPVLQIWVKDDLERDVSRDKQVDAKLYDEFIEQIMLMAREYRSLQKKRVHMRRQGGVRRQLEEVENPVEYYFGEKVIQLLELYNE